ncbi:MAG: hypothetical protein ACPIOQ_75400 [Promethearchaeia archaeon]
MRRGGTGRTAPAVLLLVHLAGNGLCAPCLRVAGIGASSRGAALSQMGTSTTGTRPCQGDEAGSTEDAAHKRRRTVQGSAATRGRTDKPRVTVIGSLPQRAGRAETDCESLGLKVHANFLAACREYRFPGSHQGVCLRMHTREALRVPVPDVTPAS